MSDWWIVAENGIAPVALVVGGGWAAWKWQYLEGLRRRREMPAPDGELTATSVPFSDEKAYLSLHALWRNRGNLPIEVCAEHSFIEYCELKGDPPVGSLRWGAASPLDDVKRVAVPWDLFVMEPQTESQLTEHFVVATGAVYAFRWEICLGDAPERKLYGHSTCHRELIWRVPESELPSAVN